MKEKMIDFMNIADYKTVRDKLFISILGIEGNEDFLETVPWRPYEDIAMIARVLVDRDGRDISSCVVTHSLANLWGKYPDKVLDQALENAPKIFPAELKSADSMLVGVKNVDMYILTNQMAVNGAAAMLYEGQLDHAVEMFGGKDICILPSSIHEVIIIPADPEKIPYLSNLVRTINHDIVDKWDVLTNSVYGYNKAEHRIFRYNVN